MIPVKRLNHAVLKVSNLDRAAAFYKRLFGFTEIERLGDQMAFLRAEGSANHHDLGLMALGPGTPAPPRHATGLYHLAWEVTTLQDLVGAARQLRDEGLLDGASDHGATKSLYAHDPDGNEFEILWLLPRERWGEFDKKAKVSTLDLDEELRKFNAPPDKISH